MSLASFASISACVRPWRSSVSTSLRKRFAAAVGSLGSSAEQARVVSVGAPADSVSPKAVDAPRGSRTAPSMAAPISRVFLRMYLSFSFAMRL